MKKSSKKTKTPRPMRSKTDTHHFSDVAIRGNWDESEDEILLNTNSNVVAALLLNRSRDSAASRRFTLVNKFNRTSVPMEHIGFKQAKSIVSKILKEKKKNMIPQSIIQERGQSSMHDEVNNLPSHTKKVTTQIIESIPTSDLFNPILLVLNNQEIFFKNGINKLIIKGENVTFSVE